MVRFQDDFYEAVNGEWAKAAVIPNDKPLTGGFVDLHNDIENLMMDVTAKWLQGEALPQDSALQQFVNYHRLVADYEQRNQLGTTPVAPLIDEYKKMASFSDFIKVLGDLALAGKPTGLPFAIEPDFMNAKVHVLWAKDLDTILPDTTYYEDGHPQKAELLSLWRQSQAELLQKFDFSDEELTDLLDKVEELDACVAKVVLSNEEQSEYTKLYHPYKWEEFAALTPELPLEAFFLQVLGQVPEQIMVENPRFWQKAKEIYCEENWEYLKAYLLLALIQLVSPYLTDEIRILSGVYDRALSGTPEAQSKEKAAYYLAQTPFEQALGLWYAQEKFSPEAKADVENKVATMIEVYKKRLANNRWLTKETCQQAIVKLEKITPYIGYPETVPERYQEKVIDMEKSLWENAQFLMELDTRYAWSQWGKKVDPEEWDMPAHMVNAYYDSQQNKIVFPAAILQAPFYSLDQSSSENYGGIGAVIAHEISHAFDTNGASFDEYGSLKNWWTKEDYQAFQEKTQQVVDLFEGQDSYGAKVNGKLTVAENVADLGGLAAALEAAKQEKDFSAEAFFTNWARIWRKKARVEFMQLLASIDVHGPAKLRVNLQVPNFAEFLEAFHVTEEDAMWRKPEERIVIW